MPTRPAFGQPVPPPYRAPPRHPYQQQPQTVGTPAYSKFNVSEPNVALGVSGFAGGTMVSGPPSSQPMPNSGTFERHTINHEHSQRMQNGLRNLFGGGMKHQTLDGHGQAAALHHLRSNGIQPHGMHDHTANGNAENFGPDALRDTANRLFTRNNNDRASFGGVANVGPPSAPSQTHMASFRPGFSPQGSPGRFASPATNHQMSSLPADNSQKRLSYTNQSFRKAVNQELHQNSKVPPQVPPKPFSRSTSKERLKDEGQPDSLANSSALDDELRTILSGGRGGGFNSSAATPPLPALSPVDMSQHSHQNNRKMRDGPDASSSRLKHRPDLLGDAEPPDGKKSLGKGLLPPGAALDLQRVLAVTGNGDTSATDEDHDHEDDDDDGASTAIDMGDAASIRKQLDGLENMYSEVLKLLGLKKYGRPAQPHNVGDLRGGFPGRRSKLYGSMSSLPSVSSIGSRHLYKGDRRHYHHKTDKSRANGERNNPANGRDRNYNKRFQRLESHVVTLARSVAHLSSEMRSQHLIVQEIEALRNEVEQLRLHSQQTSQQNRNFMEPEQFLTFVQNGGNFPSSGIVSTIQANRVKKLTKFFGDEPPLLRLFLKNLGYEKYATVFEESKIGMLELPYLSEDRLEKLGIPLGPRMRILQESRVVSAVTQKPTLTSNPVQQLQQQQHHHHQNQTESPNYNVYIL